MKTKSITLAAVLFFAAAGQSFGQTPAPKGPESYRYRTILTAAGGGGGFALGVFAGIGLFDDAPYATKKITTTAAIFAAGGAIGGYFLGRHFDKRKKAKVIVWAPLPVRDELDRSLLRAQREAMFGVESGGFPERVIGDWRR